MMIEREKREATEERKESDMNERGEKNKIKIKTYINFFATCHNTLLPYNRQYIVKKKKKKKKKDLAHLMKHGFWCLV